LAQTYPDVEVIVVDDGSTDETRERMEDFGNRIKYVHQINSGACAARNAGLRLAQGKYIGFIDCDDLYAPNKVAVSVDHLKRYPHYGWIHTAAYFIDKNDEIISLYSHPKSRHRGWISAMLVMGNYICNSTVLARRECFEKAGFFDQSIFMPADWDMWLRMAEHYQAGYIPLPLTKYRVVDNYVFKNLDAARREEEVVINHFLKRNPSLSSLLRNKIYSNFHLRFAQCYFLKDERPQMIKEFRQAISLYPFNNKALAELMFYIFDKNFLRDFLSEKIIRYQQKSGNQN
jgi:glycosyltransferase involved in cell wall biosynthesis